LGQYGRGVGCTTKPGHKAQKSKASTEADRQTDRARLRRTRHTRREARRGWVENARALADRATSIAREKLLGQTIVVDLWSVTSSNLIRKVGFSCGHLTS
jgi:hypothetical protein